MSQKLRVRKTPKSRSKSGSLSLPSEYVNQSFDRLAYLAMVYAVTYLIAAYLIPGAHPTSEGGIASDRTLDLIGLVFIAGALFLAIGIKTGSIKPCNLTAHGIAFQIYGAIGISISLITWNGDASLVPIGPGWTSVWILSLPLFLPIKPRYTLVTSLITASVLPLMILLIGFLGVPIPSLIVLLPAIAPAYICAGIATFACKIIHGIGQDVAAAKRMGSYRLVERLGEGGMGEVWRAEHALLARSAAIKLIKTEGMAAAQRDIQLERFEREVQATARLQSPHTIAVYDFGRTTDGTFYYVMEHLDGLSLDQLVQKYGQQRPSRVARILRQMCHSLGEAHELGIVHRDLKPANIFLCRQGRETDFVKILDFGLVKLDLPVNQMAMELTQVGHFIGTPNFASPEMANGEIDRVDQRTDIYQLGCVAFWLLTGRNVFDADNAIKMLLAHADKTPDPPSMYADEPLPAALDRIVLKCLAKEMDDRYATVDELSNELGVVESECAWCPDEAAQWWCDCGIQVPHHHPGVSRDTEKVEALIQPVG